MKTYFITLFFLSTNLLIDGMSEKQEDVLFEKLKTFSSRNALELKILPHRTDIAKYKKIISIMM